MRQSLVLVILSAGALACGSGRPAAGGDGGTPPPAGPPEPPPGPPGWAVAAREDFSGDPLAAAAAAPFAPDPVPDDGPYADGGAFFRARGVTPPAAFRATQPIGTGGWLSIESYTRRAGAPLSEFVSIAIDPSDPANRALRISSREHTDATVVRPTWPLPARYRISLRLGFPAFGDGQPGLNGYGGGEKAGPWWPDEDATSQNGFYWLAILDHVPRPHVNAWIHHQRKVVVDSDSHYPPWMEIWDGERFLWSGERPVNVFALDGRRHVDARSGNALITYSAGAWQPPGTIRAADSYLPDTWYRVSVERDGPRYTLEVSGRFRHGGERTHRATIDAAASCVWHYPATAEEASGAKGCEDATPLPGLGAEFPRWPANGVWPDWFMFGDPHVNYYEGEVLYDDVVLELWRG
ncbi:MAG TPA: hypothetical protein VIW03_05890 [Anaeromyxobacter sp.]